MILVKAVGHGSSATAGCARRETRSCKAGPGGGCGPWHRHGPRLDRSCLGDGRKGGCREQALK